MLELSNSGVPKEEKHTADKIRKRVLSFQKKLDEDKPETVLFELARKIVLKSETIRKYTPQ